MTRCLLYWRLVMVNIKLREETYSVKVGLTADLYHDTGNRGFYACRIYLRPEVEEWVKENIRGDYAISTNDKSIYFQLEEEAVAFKLAWC